MHTTMPKNSETSGESSNLRTTWCICNLFFIEVDIPPRLPLWVLY